MTTHEDGLREALKSASSWLERWASHVGDCPTGCFCTCGLTAIRYEAEHALSASPKPAESEVERVAVAIGREMHGPGFDPFTNPEAQDFLEGIARAAITALSTPKQKEASSDPERPLENNVWIEQARGTLDHLGSALQRLQVPWRMDWREWIDQLVEKYARTPSDLAEARRIQMNAWLDTAIASKAALAEALEVMRPFANTAEYDIGEDEADSDIFRPMFTHNHALHITVGALRRAAAFVEKHRGGGK